MLPKKTSALAGPPKAKRRRIAKENNPFLYKAIGGFIVIVYTIILILENLYKGVRPRRG
jgi:hypothetical protein